MEITTKQVLRILYILSWIIFTGICIETGGTMFASFYTLVINSVNAKHFWPGIDLSNLYAYDHGQFLAETIHMIMPAIFRAILFYLIMKILHDKKLDMTQPFNKEMGRFIFRISYLSFIIGLLSWWGVKYTEWLISQGVKMPDIQHLGLGGADVWMFMGVTLYVIAQIFKRGIEIQTENDLTI
ncbi:MAG TPA: DUF2975 domain-containing protein [Puia sp.]|nr:DUF2975 domain-containing protein [Puia sp.]